MSTTELHDLIATVVEMTAERKLIEFLGDPDQRLVTRRKVRERLLRQQQAVATGDRGHEFEAVARARGWD